MTNLLSKCTRCRHIHNLKNRVEIKGKDGFWHSSCPRCKGRITTEVTWFDFHFEVIKLKPLWIIDTDLIEEAFKLKITPKEFIADLKETPTNNT